MILTTPDHHPDQCGLSAESGAELSAGCASSDTGAARTCQVASSSVQRHLPPSREVLHQIFLLTGRCGALESLDDPERMIDTIAWLYQDLAPKGAMQTLLASQIVATYLVVMHQLYKTSQEQLLPSANMRVNMAAKLMRSLHLQLGLLATLQGVKMQSIKVEHLNVSGNSVIGIGGRVDQGRSSQ